MGLTRPGAELQSFQEWICSLGFLAQGQRPSPCPFQLLEVTAFLSPPPRPPTSKPETAGQVFLIYIPLTLVLLSPAPILKGPCDDTGLRIIYWTLEDQLVGKPTSIHNLHTPLSCVRQHSFQGLGHGLLAGVAGRTEGALFCLLWYPMVYGHHILINPGFCLQGSGRLPFLTKIIPLCSSSRVYENISLEIDTHTHTCTHTPGGILKGVKYFWNKVKTLRS